MSRCKAHEVLRSEAYLDVRCNDEGGGESAMADRWAFFSSLLDLIMKNNCTLIVLGAGPAGLMAAQTAAQ